MSLFLILYYLLLQAGKEKIVYMLLTMIHLLFKDFSILKFVQVSNYHEYIFQRINMNLKNDILYTFMFVVIKNLQFLSKIFNI